MIIQSARDYRIFRVRVLKRTATSTPNPDSDGAGARQTDGRDETMHNVNEMGDR